MAYNFGKKLSRKGFNFFPIKDTHGGFYFMSENKSKIHARGNEFKKLPQFKNKQLVVLRRSSPPSIRMMGEPHVYQLYEKEKRR